MYISIKIPFVKKVYKVLLCNFKFFFLLLLDNKDTLKRSEYTQILPKLKVNAMWRNVAQSNAKLIMTLLRKLSSFKFAVSVEDARMADCMFHSSFGHRLLRLNEACLPWILCFPHRNRKIWRKGKSGDKQALKNHVIYFLVIYFP